MANVRFDADSGMYSTEVESDSNPYEMYTILFDPMTDSFHCECPAFRYSRDRHCKHISRNGSVLTDYIDALDSESHLDTSFKAGPTKEEGKFNVVLNDGLEKVLDRSTVEWLLSVIRPDDELVIQRR